MTTISNPLSGVTFNDIKILCGIAAFTTLTALKIIPPNEGLVVIGTLIGTAINTSSANPIITTTTTAPTANITTSVTKPA